MRDQLGDNHRGGLTLSEQAEHNDDSFVHSFWASCWNYFNGRTMHNPVLESREDHVITREGHVTDQTTRPSLIPMLHPRSTPPPHLVAKPDTYALTLYKYKGSLLGSIRHSLRNPRDVVEECAPALAVPLCPYSLRALRDCAQKHHPSCRTSRGRTLPGWFIWFETWVLLTRIRMFHHVA